MFQTFKHFIRMESAGGIVLFFAAVLAMVCDNTGLSPYYNEIFMSSKLTLSIGTFGLSKPLILWINDGLMAIFFLLVGLEIKRELLEGELNTVSKAVLPAIAALGGMVVPALFYIVINYGHSEAINGWAIPTATDIAFSLGVLALLGTRIPITIKVFLTALAIMDDLGAIIIIAIYYTTDLSLYSLGLAAACILALFLLNRSGVSRFSPYGVIGFIMWFCVLKSGVHATLAGIILALLYPLRDKHNYDRSPARELEKWLHPYVAFGVLPIFAFANAGVPLSDISLSTLMQPIPLGIAAGLFFGKQLGIFGFCYLAIKLKLAQLPRGANWMMIYGIALICGIGFTMSLFIGSLAFDNTNQGDFKALIRVGVLCGSLLAGVGGYLVLRFFCKSQPHHDE